MTIPADAAPAGTEITVTEFSATDPSLPTPPTNSLSRVLEFGPSGQTFTADVTIVFSYTDAEVEGKIEESLQVNLLVDGSYVTVGDCTGTNPPSPEDPCVSARDTTANTITVVTRHFSLYALSAPTATPTPTPTPVLIHDASVKRVGSPHWLRLSPGVIVTKPVTVVVRNEGDHADDIGVYLALLPPGGWADNPGGCMPAGVVNWVDYATGGAQTVLTGVPAGGRVSLKADVSWSCTNPSAVDGQSWTLKAIADHGGDDFAACDTLLEVFDGVCESSLADDDPPPDNNDNSLSRSLPIVRFVP